MPLHPNYSLAMNKRRLHLSGPKVDESSAKSIYKLYLHVYLYVFLRTLTHVVQLDIFSLA